jgi:AraC-like DNA-binding protein
VRCRGDVLIGDHYLVANLLGKYLPSYCRNRNIDFNSIASSMKIDAENFRNPATYMQQSKFAELLEALSFTSTDQVLGLNYAAEYNVSNLGLFGLGFLNATTFSVALHFYQRFVSLLIDHVQFDVSNSEEKVTMIWRYTPFVTNKSQLIDFEMALAVKLFRHFTGNNWTPAIAYLERTKPSNNPLQVSPLAQHVIYKSDFNALSFSSNLLHCKNASSDSRVFELLERQCEQELKMISIATPIARRVRNEILKRLPKDECSLVEIAKMFSMSERNFQRKLSNDGTSLEQILEDTRRQLSDHLLKNSELAIAEISIQLGYSSPNAYSRAAKNWYERPPSKVRNELSVTTSDAVSGPGVFQNDIRLVS